MVAGWQTRTPRSRCAGSFDERHLVDFAERGLAEQDLLHRALAQEPHAFLARRLLDLRGRTPGENQLADVVAQVEQLADRRAALVAGAAALDAARPFEEPPAELQRRIQRRLRQLRACDRRRPLAVR